MSCSRFVPGVASERMEIKTRNRYMIVLVQFFQGWENARANILDSSLANSSSLQREKHDPRQDLNSVVSDS